MKNKRFLILVVIVTVFVIGIAGIAAVRAYMFRQTETLTNEFEPAIVTCWVDETFDKTANKKTEVSIQNTGNIKSYLRVRIVTYWQDSKGNAIYRPSPEVSLTVDENYWLKDDANDTYYYKYPVDPEGFTEELLNGQEIVLTKDDDPVGGVIYTYYSVVEFIGEAIQAEPSKAVSESWGVTVNSDGIITGFK